MERKGVHLNRGNFSGSVWEAHWNGEDRKGLHSGPQRRKTFTPRPGLEKNFMLAGLEEELKKTGLQAAAADRCYAGAEDVACDVCTGRKRIAVKSCQEHQLMDPSKNLQENICPRRDQQSVCYLCSVEEHEGHETVAEVDVLQPEPEPEPQTRDELLKHSRELTLDPNTAHTYLLISEGNRRVMLMYKRQSYSYHPDRFIHYCQALSRESLTGRCYWEVDWRGEGVRVSVAYRSMSRGMWADACEFGLNKESWGLCCDPSCYTFWHDNIQTPVSGRPSSRIGVYLDHGAGILCFYSVSGTMTLLHRVQTAFTEPLHAGLYVWSTGSSAEFVNLQCQTAGSCSALM